MQTCVNGYFCKIIFTQVILPCSFFPPLHNVKAFVKKVFFFSSPWWNLAGIKILKVQHLVQLSFVLMDRSIQGIVIAWGKQTRNTYKSLLSSN